jgi:NAD(P) transhydrogenase subunit beta
MILTQIMCKGMNRSLANVIFGAVGGEDGGSASGEGQQLNIKSYSTEEAAMIFDALDVHILIRNQIDLLLTILGIIYGY